MWPRDTPELKNLPDVQLTGHCYVTGKFPEGRGGIWGRGRNWIGGGVSYQRVRDIKVSGGIGGISPRGIKEGALEGVFNKGGASRRRDWLRISPGRKGVLR